MVKNWRIKLSNAKLYSSSTQRDEYSLPHRGRTRWGGLQAREGPGKGEVVVGGGGGVVTLPPNEGRCYTGREQGEK